MQTSKSSVPLVAVVDDDDGVRRSLSLLLGSMGYRVAAYPSAGKFLGEHDSNQAGCLVLDVRMPEMSGLELQRELNRRGTSLPVIFITGHGDIPMAVEAMKFGAFDFIQKPFRDQDLLDRVNQALQADAKHRSALAHRDGLLSCRKTLTPREREVMDLIVEGKPNKVIAQDLEMSERTVEIHRSRVMEKMGVRSVAQLVRMAIELSTATVRT